MTESSRFWSGRIADGASGDAGPYSMDQMAAVYAMLMGGKRGVLSGLVVKESAPAAKSITVETGNAIISGILYESEDSEVDVDISSNVSGNPRIDVIVLEADWSGAAAQTIRLSVVEGTPAGSPAVPSLTQTSGTLWQESIAEVAVANGFSTIVNANITRTRVWVRPEYPGKFEQTILTEASIPDGWLLCYGQAVSRTTYIDLFDAIGTDFGVGDGSTTFNLPDMRGRVAAGKDDMGGVSANVITNAQADSLGGEMGTETHTLTTAQMPAHTHSETQYTLNNTEDGSSHQQRQNTTGGTTGSTGSGNAHNNVQPTTFINFMVKT